MVESLIVNADLICSDLEKTSDERLASSQNKSTSLQGQIDLLRSHQAGQDRKIGFALAREAEEADGRLNERFGFRWFNLYYLIVICYFEAG